jgi:hypothetical protein
MIGITDREFLPDDRSAYFDQGQSPISPIHGGPSQYNLEM